MDLTQEDIDWIADKLNQQWEGYKCEICGNKKWYINPKIFALNEFDMDEKNGEKFYYTSNNTLNPLILVACRNCGNTKTINAVQFGVLKE